MTPSRSRQWRILLVTPNFPPAAGGAQRWSHEIALHLAMAGHDVCIVAPRSVGADAFDREQPFAVKRCLSFRDGLALTGIAPVRRAIRSFRPDVILCAHWSATYAALIAAPSGLPVICAVHGREVQLTPLSGFRPAQMIYNAIRRYTFSHAAAFICVSHFTRDLMKGAGVDQSRLHVVFNGVNAARFVGGDGQSWRRSRNLLDGRLLLTVARLVPRKGIDTVIDALPAVSERYPTVVYAIAGSGPDQKRLREKVQANGLDDRVVFLGEITERELRDVYNACDVFILPAREDLPEVEGFGLVFLEAGANSRPVIGANTGGIPDAVIHGRTGILVDTPDRHSVAQATLELLADRELSAKYGRQGRALALKCRTWGRATQNIVKIMESVSMATER